ncbi:MAG: M28 family peptidase [Alphaproteobacteria bacterium]|nr:M28 family peptidase [Alphaproteobacteria bacterium]
MLALLLAACTSTPTPTDTDPADTDPVDTDAPDTAVPTPPVPTDPEGFAATVQVARYQADLEALAVPRGSGTPGWQAAQDRCFTTLQGLGFDTTLHTFDSGTNVVGRKPGTASEGAVIVSAHYDSVPGCPGADDNASGVAGALEVARVLAPGTFTHDLVVACWDREEAGLLGSRAWATSATEPIRMMWSFEMIGYASDEPGSQSLPFGFDFVFPAQTAQVQANDMRGDFALYVGDPSSAPALAPFEQAAANAGLPVVSIQLTAQQLGNPFLADLGRSDHKSFWDAGFPAVMVTDTANFRNDRYHCTGGPDGVARLDADFAAATVAATVGATVELLVPTE